METPSSTRRITRSQDLASENNSILMSRKFEETEKGLSKSRQRAGKQQDRSVLIDITNDSPIVGLAMGNLDNTPSSNFSKKRFNVSSKYMNTPGSGEALLRGQVKTLLQKVEEEAVLSKISIEYGQILTHHGIVRSPSALLAPTPANTPQVYDISGNGSLINDVLASVSVTPVEEQFTFSQMVNDLMDGRRQDSSESEKDLITRSLLLDFSEKSEDSVSSDDCTSMLTYQGECVSSEGSKYNKSSANDDDDASVWSIQVNASTQDEEEQVEDSDLECEEEEEYYEDENEYYNGDLLVDELCEGISKISVNGVEFTGKHTRFVYNSDDEFEGEVGESGDEMSAASGVLRLKGLPTPKGKHVRFPDEEEEEEWKE